MTDSRSAEQRSWMTFFFPNFLLSLSSLQNNTENTSTFLSAGAALSLASCGGFQVGKMNHMEKYTPSIYTPSVHTPSNTGASTTKACLEETLSDAVVQCITPGITGNRKNYVLTSCLTTSTNFPFSPPRKPRLHPGGTENRNFTAVSRRAPSTFTLSNSGNYFSAATNSLQSPPLAIHQFLCISFDPKNRQNTTRKKQQRAGLTTSVGRKYLGSTWMCTTPVSWQRPISCSSLPSHLERRKS